MGCTAVRVRSLKVFSNQIKKKLNCRVVSTEFSLLLPQSTIVSRENTSTQPKCLKLQILPKSPKFSHNCLNFEKTQLFQQGQNYIIYYDYIKRLYSDYSTAKRNFCNRVHESCFQNFEITDGIAIMMISLAANEDSKVSYIENSPYVKIEGAVHFATGEIFKDWEEFSKIVEKVLSEYKGEIEKTRKELKGFLKVLEEYAEFALRPGRLYGPIAYIESAVETMEEIVKEAKTYKKTIAKYFSGIQGQKKIIAQLGTKAAALKIFEGEQIVHCLFTDSIIKFNH